MRFSCDQQEKKKKKKRAKKEWVQQLHVERTSGPGRHLIIVTIHFSIVTILTRTCDTSIGVVLEVVAVLWEGGGNWAKLATLP